jgi:hypothetical protein
VSDSHEETPPVRFSLHALQQMRERGASEDEVRSAIRSGEAVPAKAGRRGYRLNFQYNAEWAGRHFAVKQVLAIVAQDPDAQVVVTVYTFYF